MAPRMHVEAKCRIELIAEPGLCVRAANDPMAIGGIVVGPARDRHCDAGGEAGPRGLQVSRFRRT